MPKGADPAEAGYLRWFYRGWRPTPLGRAWSRLWAWLAGLGVLSPRLVALQTSHPETGRRISTVLAPAQHHGRRYLVSMLGDRSRWVRNVRASGGEAWLKRGPARPVILTERPVGERGPILRAWARTADSGRRHLPLDPDASDGAFERIAADYPVFRIDPR